MTAYRISNSTVTGHSPFILLYAHAPKYPLTNLLDTDDPSRTFENRLELHAELMTATAKVTEDSRVFNQRRLHFCSMKAELGWGQLGLMRRIFYETCPRAVSNQRTSVLESSVLSLDHSGPHPRESGMNTL